MKIFLDANILIDIMLEREPFYAPAVAFITFCISQEYKITTNSLCISNAFYLSQKLIRNNKITKNKINTINSICSIIPMNQSQLNMALESDFIDFEDSLHNACAIHNDCTHIITRDKKGFKNSKLKVFTPSLFLKLYGA
ncbi:PIN domain-containing protein [Nonlabens sp.]|uniref:type II toxin-antitoxin system VapC family toxin n=1 Tax=Nonlabens sp. TaxID=1888209 RepID=UPI001BCC0D32|nr:PIN domain-containing protein [Nonlabens sp.]